MHRAAALATVAFAAVAATAGALQPPVVGGPPPQTYVKRSRTQPAELPDIANGAYEDRPVRTRGTLSPFERPYWVLEQGTARVLVIAAANTEQSLAQLVGRRLEVDGLVRRLVENQGTCQIRRVDYPLSYCKDPDLPPAPDIPPGRNDWPRVSITVWAALELTPLEGTANRRSSRSYLADLLDARVGEELAVRGRFCGAALCGQPKTPAPAPDAWLLVDDDLAVWVVGREPRGKGFRLDPAYAGDTNRWVEVKGRVERCGAAVCLRAKSVALAPSPPPVEP